MRTEHENGLSSLFDKRFEINLKVKLVLGTNSFQSNRSHLRTQRYTNHTHTQNVRPRERWQWHARKWIAKQSSRRTAEQNRRSKTHRFFTRSKGRFVNQTRKPYEPSVQNRHVSVIDVIDDDYDDYDGYDDGYDDDDDDDDDNDDGDDDDGDDHEHEHEHEL